MSDIIKSTLEQTKYDCPVYSIGFLDYSSRLTDSEDSTYHNHDFVEFFYITRGEIEHEIDGKIECLKLGDAYLLFPGKAHGFIRKSSCIHRDICIGLDRFKSHCESIDKTLYERLSNKGFLKIEMTVLDIQNFEDKANKYSVSEDMKYYEILKKLIVDSIIDKAYSQILTFDVSNINDRNMFINVINECFTHKEYIEEIRNRLGYTNSYLCHKFKNIFGMTLSDYIKKKRVEHASYLLVYTNMSIDDIVYEIGLDSRNYFNKIFKEYYGKTPTQYKYGK